MAESNDQRHATRVGLRTLRQRPKLIDHTEAGEPVYEVRSVRLLLPPESSHFSRLVACAKCGQDTSGSKIISAADLDRAPNAVICKQCVKASGLSVARAGESPSNMTSNGPGPATVDEAPVGEQDSVAPSTDDVWVRIKELQTEIADTKDADRARASLVEDQVRRTVAQVLEELERQRSDVVATAAAVAEARSDIERLAESGRRTVLGQSALDQRIEALAASAGAAASSEPVDAVDGEGRRLAEARLGELANLTRRLEARLDGLDAAAQAGASRLDALEQLFKGSVDRLVAIVEAQDKSLAAGSTPNGSGSAEPRPVPTKGANLLEALERQLEEAGTRLVRRAAALATPDRKPSQQGS